MKQFTYTAIVMAAIFAAFMAIASAQSYYPAFGPISWSPPPIYQPAGVPISGYNYGYSAWRPMITPQPQGVCVTCGGYGAWGGSGSGAGSGTWGNSYFVGQNGYYPNGYTYTIRDRRSFNNGDGWVIRNRVRTETFRPF